MPRFLIIILFIALFVITIAGAHYFIYFSLNKFFNITSIDLKRVIIIIFFLWPFIFILTSVLAGYFNNFFINSLYLLAGWWLGLAVTLIFFFALVWAVVWGGRLIGWQINLSLWGGLAIIIAIAYLIFGIYNAVNPRIREIEVIIKNLPDNWRDKKVVQISDLHLGHILGADFLKKVIDNVNDIQPQAVFITGDFFDSSGDGYEYIITELNRLEVEKGIYFITGNHETYYGLDKIKDILDKTRVRILNNEMEAADGLQIIGLSYPERLDKKDLEQAISEIDNFDRAGPSILLYHSPVQIEAVKRAGINLMLSGHTHKGQIFPLGFITKLIYRGYDYGLKQSGDFSIYTSSGTGVWGPLMRTSGYSEIVVITLKQLAINN